MTFNNYLNTFQIKIQPNEFLSFVYLLLNEASFFSSSNKNDWKHFSYFLFGSKYGRIRRSKKRNVVYLDVAILHRVMLLVCKGEMNYNSGYGLPHVSHTIINTALDGARSGHSPVHKYRKRPRGAWRGAVLKKRAVIFGGALVDVDVAVCSNRRRRLTKFAHLRKFLFARTRINFPTHSHLVKK